MRKSIKQIIVGCVVTALLAVPVMAFAAPSATDAEDTADNTAIVDQQDATQTDGTDTTDTPDESNPLLDDAAASDAPAEQSAFSGPSAAYYIVGGALVLLGVGFYIALTIKSKRR